VEMVGISTYLKNTTMFLTYFTYGAQCKGARGDSLAPLIQGAEGTVTSIDRGDDLNRHWPFGVRQPCKERFRPGRPSRWKLLLLAATAVGMLSCVGTIRPGYAMTSDIQKRALGGDLGAQRDLVDCLTKGCQGIPPDRALACAWRIVMVAGGAAGLSAADVEGRRLICASLSPPEQAKALEQAKSLFKHIHGRDLVVPADFFGGPTRRNPGQRP
jgi:hypothetical protein